MRLDLGLGSGFGFGFGFWVCFGRLQAVLPVCGCAFGISGFWGQGRGELILVQRVLFRGRCLRGLRVEVGSSRTPLTKGNEFLLNL
jgi:hypothetical protein